VIDEYPHDAEHVGLGADVEAAAWLIHQKDLRRGTLDVIHSCITDEGIRDEDVRAFESRGIKAIIAG